MNLLDVISAIFMLGLPMVVLSWVIFSWIFLSGEVDRQEKRNAITARVKKLKTLPGLEGNRGKRYLYDKWAWFGSGFYGLAGFWTLIVIELGEFIGFLSNPGSITSVDAGDILGLIIGFFIDQLANLLQAFLWWSYWPAESLLVWLAVAYLGYWIGVELARNTHSDALEQVLKSVRSRFRARSK